MTDRDDGAADRLFQFDPFPTGQVLTEVHNVCCGFFALFDGDRFQRHDPADGGAALPFDGGEGAAVDHILVEDPGVFAFQNFGAVFIPGGFFGGHPGVGIFLCIKGFAEINVTEALPAAGRVGLNTVIFIGDDLFRCAVGVGQVQFLTECRVGTVCHIAAVPVPCDHAAEPAFRQQVGKHVDALFDEFRHVVCLILHAVVVVRPAGGENIFRDIFAIDVCLIQPQRGGVETRFRQFLFDFKASEQAAYIPEIAHAVVAADPFAGPGGIDETGFKERFFLTGGGGFPVFILELDAPVVAGEGIQRSAEIGDLGAAVIFHEPGVPHQFAIFLLDNDLVGRLRVGCAGEFIGETGDPFVHADGVGLVFDLEAVCSQHEFFMLLITYQFAFSNPRFHTITRVERNANGNII